MKRIFLAIVAAFSAITGASSVLASDSCRQRFQATEPYKIFRYADDGGTDIMIEVCPGPNFQAPTELTQIFNYQEDEYSWSGKDYTYVKSRDNLTINCKGLAGRFRKHGAEIAEDVLCNQVEMPNDVTVLHVQDGCWHRFARSKTTYYGSFAMTVYCQVPNYNTSSNKRVQSDAYYFSGTFLQHLSIIDCTSPNLASAEKTKLCNNPL